MAWAVPRAFCGVPTNKTAQMRANRRSRRDFARSISGHRGLRAVHRNDFALSALDRSDGAGLRAPEPIAHEIVRVILVLDDVIPGAISQPGAPDIKQLAPRIRAADDTIARHHPAERT